MPPRPRPGTETFSPARNALRSMPALNVPPAPVTTPSVRSARSSSSVSAAAMPSDTARLIAFFARGRLIVISCTPSRCSTSTSSLMSGI
jgi:hypothetical protein